MDTDPVPVNMDMKGLMYEKAMVNNGLRDEYMAK